MERSDPATETKEDDKEQRVKARLMLLISSSSSVVPGVCEVKKRINLRLESTHVTVHQEAL